MPEHPQNPIAKPWIRLTGLVVAILVPLVLGALLSWHSLGELDVWLHQAAGREILQGEGFLRTNHFTFTDPDRPWTNHEWFFQVLVRSVGMERQSDPASGIQRWNLLRVLMTTLLLGWLLLGSRPWRAPPLRLLGLAPGLVLGTFLLWPRLLLRPELLSYLWVVLLVRLAERDAPRPGAATGRGAGSFLRTREAVAFVLTVLWAQWHGFSAIAPGIWLLAGLLSFVPPSGLPRLPFRRWALGAALLTLAQLLTPNGVEGLLYPLRALGEFSAEGADPTTTISELVPLFSSPDSLGGTLVAFQLSVVWAVLLVLVGLPRCNLLRVLLWLATLAAALAAQRNLGLYAVAFLLLNLDYLKHNQGRVPFIRIPRRLKPVSWLLAGCALLGAAWLGAGILDDSLYLREGVSRRFGSGVTPARFAFRATDMLGPREGLRLFANVDAAAFAVDRAPVRVFIDGRTEAHTPHLWREYRQAGQGGPAALAILDRHGAEAVLLATGGRTFQQLAETLLDSDRWRLAAADEAGLLWLRRPASGGEDRAFLRQQVRALASLASGQPLARNMRQADRLAALAHLAEMAGDGPAADRLLKQGLEVGASHPLLNHNLGNRLLAAGELDRAAERFERALKVNGRLAGAAANAGVCHLRLGRIERAIALFRRAMDLDPDNPGFRANLGLALQRSGKTRQAVQQIEKALELDPGNQNLQRLLRDLRNQI